MGVIPIVNENDTLAVSEIKFGDNDTLSAITAAMVHADLLFLMTDVDCLYDKNPRIHPDAHPIEVVEDIGSLVADGMAPVPPPRKPITNLTSLVSTAGSSLGTGGMSTKIVAARLATSAGVTTVITRSSSPGNIVKIVKHIQASRSPPSLATKANQSPDSSLDQPQHQTPTAEEALAHHHSSSATPDSERTLTSTPIPTPKIPLHTRFLPSPHPVRDRYFWILHGLRPHGTLYIDQGAFKALVGKAGLLPVGVVEVEGVFAQQEAVRLCVVDRKKRRANTNQKTEDGSDGGAGTGTGTGTTTGEVESAGDGGKLWEGEAREVGRALSNYSSAEIARIKGRQSVEVEGILGYADSEYVAQRESISFYAGVRESRPATPVREVVDGRGIGGYEGEGAVL